MKAVAHGDPTAAARAVVLESAHAYRDVFADRFVAAYALGSLARGGYAPAVSDIDLAVVVSETSAGDAETVADTCRDLNQRGELYRKLSVFWTSLDALREGRDDGRMPAIDRLDLVEQGLLLLGSDVAPQAAIPTVDELLIDSARFAVTVLATDEVTAELRQPRRLLADTVWFTKAVLFPVRFLYSSTIMGRAATNDAAIAWYLAQPETRATPLVRFAAQVRNGQPLDPQQAAPLLSAGLVDLYLRYAEGHSERLRQAGAPADLVAAVTRWHEELAQLAAASGAPM